MSVLAGGATVLGLAILSRGKGKLLHLGPDAGFFASLNIPLPKLNAILAGSTECFGGLLLLLGLGSRIATVPLIVTMCVAYLTADIDKVKHIFDKPDAFLTPIHFYSCWRRSSCCSLGRARFPSMR